MKREGIGVFSMAEMRRSMESFFPSFSRYEGLVDIIDEAFKYADGNLGISAAIEWGKDFTWPEVVFTRDMEQLKDCDYDLEQLVNTLRRGDRGRLSIKRISAWVPMDDPDRDLLVDLVEGMRVIVSEKFVLNPKPAPLRSLYVRVSRAVNRMLYALWQDNLVFIIPTELLIRMNDVHFSPAHWAKKFGSPSGRNIFDSSDQTMGASPLNSEDARGALEEMYGPIVHPTLQDLVEMIVNYTRRKREELGVHFDITKVVLWKADLARAFTLLDFRSSDVKRLACSLTDDLSVVFHTGLFGWTGTPFAFQVVTRVLKRLIQARVLGAIDMFVDDIIGVSYLTDVDHDKSVAKQCCEGLLGPTAMAPKKWETSRRLDVIGWTIDLDLERVSIKRSNFMKALYGFFSVDDQCISILEIERLASWASRYSELLREMRPFTTFLYHESNNYKRASVTKRLGHMAVLTVQLWKAILCILMLDEVQYGRSLMSFMPGPAEYLICYDASLTGVGVSVTSIVTNKVLAVLSAPFPFTVEGDSSFQNTAEFIGIVTGYVMIALLGISNASIQLKGDSISSLQWASTEHYRSKLCFRPAVIFTLLSIAFNLIVVEAVHIAGVDNDIHDGLSRGKSPGELGFNEEIRMQSTQQYISSFLRLCDPTLAESGSVEIFWRKAIEEVNGLKIYGVNL